MIDCRDIQFSTKLSTSRMKAAEKVFGKRLIKYLIAFALYVLGGNRKQVGDGLSISPGTMRSLVRRLLQVGLKGFVDQRCKKNNSTTPVVEPTQSAVSSPAFVCLSGKNEGTLTLKGQVEFECSNLLQQRVIVLSLIGKGMLSVETAAEALDISISSVRRLHLKLLTEDIHGVIDQRRGQLGDYRIDSDLKGQIAAEFILELAENGHASSSAVMQRLETSCQERVPERTIRHHLSKMGLIKMKGKLTEGLQVIKKNSSR